MGSAEHTGDALVASENRPRLAKLREQLLWIAQLFQNFRVKLPGLGIHQTHGGGIGVLPGRNTAEAVQKVFRDHEQIIRLFQPPPL